MAYIDDSMWSILNTRGYPTTLLNVVVCFYLGLAMRKSVLGVCEQQTNLHIHGV